MSNKFRSEQILPPALYARINQIRVDQPGRILQEASARERRPTLTSDGRLVIAAADHPGRFVTAASGNPLAMADRHQYLARILRVLTQSHVDGVMSTADILEELLILSALDRESRGCSFLDQKILVGCMNRGGLAGAVFEMRDRFTAMRSERIRRLRLDAAKMMLRLDLSSPDSGSTIGECADALCELDSLDIPAFVEPLYVEKRERGYSVVKSAEVLSKVICVATALGNSTRLLWLKVPYVPDFVDVAASTTCPILLLGGGSREDPEEILGEFAAGLQAGQNVRGVLVGRNILFPGPRDPASMAAAIGGLVHRRCSVPEAVEIFRAPQEAQPALAL